MDKQIQDIHRKIDRVKAGLKSKFFENTQGSVGNYFEKEINNILESAGVGSIQ